MTSRGAPWLWARVFFPLPLPLSAILFVISMSIYLFLIRGEI